MTAIYSEVEYLKSRCQRQEGLSLHLCYSYLLRKWQIMLRINDPAETNYDDLKTLTTEEARLIYRWNLLPVWYASKDETYRLFMD